MPETWQVGVIIPEAEFSSLYRYAIGAWLTMGSPAVPGPANLVGEGITKLHRLIFGGIPVSGELTIGDNTIEIKTIPKWYYKLFAEGNLDAEFSIPIEDITYISGPQSVVLGALTGTLALRKIEIRTKGAKFYLTAEWNGPALTRRLKRLVGQSS